MFLRDAAWRSRQTLALPNDRITGRFYTVSMTSTARSSMRSAIAPAGSENTCNDPESVPHRSEPDQAAGDEPIVRTLLQVALSSAACAVALGTGGVTDSRVRSAIAAVHLDRYSSSPRVIACTARESGRLLHFYKFAAAFFAEIQSDERARICREAADVITLTRERAGVVDGRRPGPRSVFAESRSPLAEKGPSRAGAAVRPLRLPLETDRAVLPDGDEFDLLE